MMTGCRLLLFAAAALVCVSARPAAFAQTSVAPVEVRGEGVTGTLRRHERFASAFVEARHVDVWLPPGYAEQRKRRYPVVYMHDGQNLFDPATSYGGVDWAIDETMTRLIREGRARAAIVVGVWNSPRRFNEYMPQRAAAGRRAEEIGGLSLPFSGPIISDDYLKFLVRELKPFIDANYRTLRGRRDTFVMGSSMGGLISVYAVTEYPAIFGGAGCVSTHWPAGDGVVIEYLRGRLPDPRTHKLYFDFGTATLDAAYEPYQRRMDALLGRAGYREGRNWLTRKFEGAEHSERAWRVRADIPLAFLLGR